MTRDDIIRMAQEAGITCDSFPGELAVERFAELVAAAERKRMARMLREDGWLQCATMVEGRSE